MGIHRSLCAAIVLFAATAARATVISYSGSIVQFVAPATGTYDITAVGAAGGVGDSGSTSNSGGLGASVHATFSLTSGQMLDILVGQIGSAGPSGGAGGGGGTYVVIHGGAALLIAGGGGGGGGDFNGGAGQSAASLTLQSSGGGAGGTATSEPDNGNGAGGGGLTGNGADGFDLLFGNPGGGKSFQNGGAGGAAGNSTVGGNGGFGGGGGGSDVGAGGGGGYTGGNGGPGISSRWRRRRRIVPQLWFGFARGLFSRRLGGQWVGNHRSRADEPHAAAGGRAAIPPAKTHGRRTTPVQPVISKEHFELHLFRRC